MYKFWCGHMFSNLWGRHVGAEMLSHTTCAWGFWCPKAQLSFGASAEACNAPNTVEENACETQFELQAQLQVLSAWPIHYACVWSPFVAVFDVLSAGRQWNLPAFRQTTEPNFSPNDSKEVSSWQRLEQGTVDEIDCGKMMWEEGTRSLLPKDAHKRWVAIRKRTESWGNLLAPGRFGPL